MNCLEHCSMFHFYEHNIKHQSISYLAATLLVVATLPLQRVHQRRDLRRAGRIRGRGRVAGRRGPVVGAGRRQVLRLAPAHGRPVRLRVEGPVLAHVVPHAALQLVDVVLVARDLAHKLHHQLLVLFPDAV